jgi:peroxiredoxin
MKKNAYIVLLLIIPFLSKAQDSFKIEGKINGLGSGKLVYLIYDAADKQIKDSTLVRDGHFAFEGKIDFPVYAALFLNKNPYVTKAAKGETIDSFRFYLENSPIVMSANDSLKKIVITGSPGNKLNTELRGMFRDNDKKMASLSKEYEALPEASKKDSLTLDGFIKREKVILNESFDIYLAFAKAHQDSYLSVIGLSYVAAQPGKGMETKKAYDHLAPKLKNSPIGKDIPILIASQELVKVGKPAPDFELNNPEGSAVRLSDFKKGYVLLDFWASWCGPCRAENPNVVAAFEKYKSKGFQVLGVSLDSPGQKDAWVKAIEKDKLNWPQISDLKGWNNTAAKLYGVRAIPANFLIDPSGIIIATDLRGDDLKRKLEELFKSN